jgi:Lipase (class 3)
VNAPRRVPAQPVTSGLRISLRPSVTTATLETDQDHSDSTLPETASLESEDHNTESILESTADSLEDTASRGVDNATPQATLTVIQAYHLARLPVLGPQSQLRLQHLMQRVLDEQQFLEGLDGVETAQPTLERSDVLRTLLAHPGLRAVRTPMTVQALGGLERVTFDGFVEQLTSSLAYSNTADFSDAKNPAPTSRNAQRLLRTFGYNASPAIHGAWGLQMMLFTPASSRAAYQQSVLAFRGTETVKPPVIPGRANVDNVDAFRRGNESELDTATDFSQTEIAYTQFDTNRTVIGEAVGTATRGGNTVVSGHSLGGALAQIAAARFPVFQKLLTFQAPHVRAEDMDRLEAQRAVQARNYRMNFDVVPRGGPPGQQRMAGEVVVFGDGQGLSGALGSHNTPMLSEVLEETRADGTRLDARQAALVEAGKQPPGELSDASGNARGIALQQVVAGREDRTVVTGGLEPVFAEQNENVVANNLMFNVMREAVLSDLERLTASNVRNNGGGTTLLQRLQRKRVDIANPDFVTAMRERTFSRETRLILEAYGEADRIFALSTPDLERETVSLRRRLAGGSIPRLKLLEVALWWRTGQEVPVVRDILQTNLEMARQDLGRWWYATNLDGADLYTYLREAKVTPRYL